MRPRPGQVLHFSEDPTITRFEPHVAPTSRLTEPYVWTVDAAHSPSYWFPRNCPRAMAWLRPETTAADRERIIGPGGGDRVHAIEYGWLERMRTTRLYAYRFDAGLFRPIGEPYPHAMVAVTAVVPLGPPEPVGDLLACHAAAGIQLRVLPNLWTSSTRWWPVRWASAGSACGTRCRAEETAGWQTDALSGGVRIMRSSLYCH